MRLLRVDSSARKSSVSRFLTQRFVNMWKQKYPDDEIMERDLPATVLPQITDDWSATYSNRSTITPEQQAYLAVSDELVRELKAADFVVIGSPMYNFTISWSLKAWIDQIVRPGETVEYSGAGPRGLLQGKKVVIFTARGGTYANKTRAPYDFQEPYLRRILEFIGLTDLEFVHAESQMQGELAASVRNAALERITQIIAGARTLHAPN